MLIAIYYSIDQLDKADAPPIPEPYIYLLGVQCLISLCEGFASCVGPLYNTIMVQRPRAAGEPVVRAPPALEVSTLPAEDPAARQLRSVYAMVECGWPALLAALSFVIATNLSEELFLDVLASYQAMTNVSGMLGLVTPRDAFFTSLSKFAIPTRVVSSLESYTESATPRTPSTFSENFGLTGPTVPPGLSERNMACLKVLISSALFLAGSLGASWFHILEALQNADYVLTTKGAKTSAKRNTIGPTPSTPAGRTVSMPVSQTSSQLNTPGGQRSSTPQPQQSGGGRHPMLADLDAEALQAAIQRLFDASKNMDDKAFHDFVSSLCKLSAAMVGMQSDSTEGLTVQTVDTLDDLSNAMLSPITESAHRRRVSGIHLPRTLVSSTKCAILWSPPCLTASISALRRFWHQQAGRCCHPQYSPPHLS